MRYAPCILFLLLTASTSVGAQDQVDTISLRFDWPVGLTARVEQEWFREKASSTRTDTLQVHATYRMQVMAHSNGRLIRADSMVIPQLDSLRADTTQIVQQMLSYVSALMPSYVVNLEGEFLEVTDMAQAMAGLDSVLKPALKRLRELSPKSHELFQSMVSERTITATAAEAWNSIVGTWVGADWEVGAVYEYEAEEPSPFLPGVAIPVKYQFSAAERIPCTEDSSTLECAELRMVSTADPQAAKDAVKKMLDRLGAKDVEEIMSALESMEVQNELTVVANPKTLIPYLVIREKRVRVRSNEATTGTTEDAGQYERRMARYHYDK